MKKTLYFDEYCGYSVAAVTEDGKLCEFYFEKTSGLPVKGNVYKGRVVSVLPGMQAMFVDCGLDKNCYLSLDDAAFCEQYEGKLKEREIPRLQEGDSVLVQIVKPSIGKKGARVTMFPSFIGKNVIYLPNTPFIGVSRKIADEELRKNLAFSVSSLVCEGEGVVLRKAAAYTRKDVIEREVEELKAVYTAVSKNYATAEVGELLCADDGLFARILRDTLFCDIERVYVGSKTLKDGVEMLLLTDEIPVTVHATARDMFEEHAITGEIKKVCDLRVELENGGYIVIDPCEALTVIDVNTGCFTGEDNLEQTVYYTNILAAREIARQVKLRNIGGIVVVDFIDMAVASHNDTVVNELANALRRGGSKCKVGEMSKFGLVEFTRKRDGISTVSALTKPCSKCKRGFVRSPKVVLLEARAKLLGLYADGERRMAVDLNAETVNVLSSWREYSDDLKNRMPDAEVFAVPHRSYPDDCMHLRKGQFEPSEKFIKII